MCGVRMAPKKSFSLTTKWKWQFKKGRPESVVVLIVSMSNYTDLTRYDNREYVFSKIFNKKDPCEK